MAIKINKMKEKKNKIELKYKMIPKKNTESFRIVALKDFADIKEGDIGGFIENKSNLSQDKDCWIYYQAGVYGKAIISGNAKIKGNSRICGCIELSGNIEIIDTNIHGDNGEVFTFKKSKQLKKAYREGHEDGYVKGFYEGEHNI